MKYNTLYIYINYYSFFACHFRSTQLCKHQKFVVVQLYQSFLLCFVLCRYRRWGVWSFDPKESCKIPFRVQRYNPFRFLAFFIGVSMFLYPYFFSSRLLFLVLKNTYTFIAELILNLNMQEKSIASQSYSTCYRLHTNCDVNDPCDFPYFWMQYRNYQHTNTKSRYYYTNKNLLTNLERNERFVRQKWDTMKSERSVEHLQNEKNNALKSL